MHVVHRLWSSQGQDPPLWGLSSNMTQTTVAEVSITKAPVNAALPVPAVFQNHLCCYLSYRPATPLSRGDKTNSDDENETQEACLTQLFQLCYVNSSHWDHREELQDVWTSHLLGCVTPQGCHINWLICHPDCAEHTCVLFSVCMCLTLFSTGTLL